jgi:sRNA-binding carbon storage regulator CsrA
MLVLSRKIGQTVFVHCFDSVGNPATVEVSVTDHHEKKWIFKLGFNAPLSIQIVRSEVSLKNTQVKKMKIYLVEYPFSVAVDASGAGKFMVKSTWSETKVAARVRALSLYKERETIEDELMANDEGNAEPVSFSSRIPATVTEVEFSADRKNMVKILNAFSKAASLTTGDALAQISDAIEFDKRTVIGKLKYTKGSMQFIPAPGVAQSEDGAEDEAEEPAKETAGSAA